MIAPEDLDDTRVDVDDAPDRGHLDGPHAVRSLEPDRRPTRPALRAGIRRRKTVRPTKKEAFLRDYIRQVVAPLGDALVDVRDRALLLIGYAGTLRRSELVALRVEHRKLVPMGLEVLVPQSKTDPFGKGEPIGIWRGKDEQLCPVRGRSALRRTLLRPQLAPRFRDDGPPQRRRLSRDPPAYPP